MLQQIFLVRYANKTTIDTMQCDITCEMSHTNAESHRIKLELAITMQSITVSSIFLAICSSSASVQQDVLNG